jgi:type I restriction enzyme, R subunit
MGFSETKSIELPAVKLFEAMGYETMNLFTEKFGSQNHLGRETSSDVVLRKILRRKLLEFNSSSKESSIDSAIEELIKDRSSLSLVRANQEVYNLLKNGVKIRTINEKGEEITEVIKIIDWNNPNNNNFLLTSQMWISGEMHNRRPDIVGFVNGLPLILGEVKKISVNIKHAYDDNLTDYKDTIPQLFWFNALVILSNGKDSKIGTFSAPWEHFNDWKRISEEGEKGIVSLDTIVKGTCEKNRLLDIVENFTLFSEAQGKLIKIITKNHQYLGVNKAIDGFFKAKERKDGKIGVFWHTTGSGKSYSMIFFSNKILRKEYGNYTFLVVTDRIDLDDQIYKNFEKTGAVTETNIRAKDCDNLKKLLKEDHRHIFTLIQKFQPECKEIEQDGKKTTIKESFPVLSERSDIIILCDEAHRTQYGELATNMRTALPNALFIAFTATPLFEDEQITMQIFGDYVSIYNFKQSVEDKATVPLYYVNRKPEVEVIDRNLNPKILKLIEDSSLDEDEVEKLREKYPKEFQVIENETRLDIVAKDIVDHFVGRGYKGKAMVVSVDRFTAVKMYNKVQQFWKRKMEVIRDELKNASLSEKTPLEAQIAFMKETDMAVVVSNSQNEIKKFKEKGLDITPHRKRIVAEDLDVKFKEPNDPLRLVFVCAMWMTGFDAPSVSTIYLDKPIRNHTLMQTISRANRVFGDKQSGTIVDYYGILRNLNKALAIYGSGSGGQAQNGDMPIRNVDELASILESNLKTMEKYFLDKGINPNDILQAKDFTRIQLLEQAVEVTEENDQSRILFLSLLRLVVNSYTDLLPDTKANRFKYLIELYVVIGETIASNSPEIDISDVEKRIADLIDRSIAVKPYSPKNSHEEIDLSKIDLPQIKASYEKGQKRTEAEKLRSIVNRKLSELLQVNRLRIDFQERLEKIVIDYNSGSTNIEQYFKQLNQFFDDLQDEEKRHIEEGLTEEELAVFDILKKPSLKVSKKEEQQVKSIVKELLEKLKEQKLVLDWKKKTRTRADVQRTIENMLNEKLPEPPFTSQVKQEKATLLYQHIYDSYQGAGQSNYKE